MRLGPILLRNYGSLRRLDLHVVVGPWSAVFMAPYYGARFGNGSRWRSGWHRWRDKDGRPCI